MKEAFKIFGVWCVACSEDRMAYTATESESYWFERGWIPGSLL